MNKQPWRTEAMALTVGWGIGNPLHIPAGPWGLCDHLVPCPVPIGIRVRTWPAKCHVLDILLPTLRVAEMGLEGVGLGMRGWQPPTMPCWGGFLYRSYRERLQVGQGGEVW